MSNVVNDFHNFRAVSIYIGYIFEIILIGILCTWINLHYDTKEKIVHLRLALVGNLGLAWKKSRISISF